MHYPTQSTSKQALTFQLLLLFSTTLLLFGSCESDSPDPTQPPVGPPKLSNWVEQQSFTQEAIQDIYFVDNSFGWAVAENLVLSTSSGGSFWQSAPLESSEQPNLINSIFFVDQETGWMAGSVLDDQGGEIFITEQGGAYPVLQQSYQAPLMAIHFLDENHGWSAGIGGKVVQTTDGGSRWQDLAELGTDIYDVHFTSATQGWAAGENGNLFKTTDGLNFELVALGVDQRLNAIHFTDTLNGWVCGRGNTLFRRHINSENEIVWSDVSIADASQAAEWMDIHFINRLTGWIVGNEGAVWKTTDGGQSWGRERVDTFETINAVHMISSTKGWIAADNGLIFTYDP
jgi:photosystem II stability/assembly factor-like uncharacterized protein